jgi:hypothetical protein
MAFMAPDNSLTSSGKSLRGTTRRNEKACRGRSGADPISDLRRRGGHSHVDVLREEMRRFDDINYIISTPNS